MENATKALLIAAAVLIVIVLVAVGVKLLNTSSGTAQSGVDTGNAVLDKTIQASDSLIDKMNSNTTSSMDEKSFNQYIKSKYTGRKTGSQVFELLNLLKGRYGSIHKDHTVTHVTCGSNGINYANIYNTVEKGKKYNISFSGSNDLYSIYITEV